MFMTSYYIKNSHKFNYQYTILEPESYLWTVIQNSIKGD